MLDDLNAVRSRLNAIGPGMCIAKWKQVTMHLQNGHTHSCHHPHSHHIPLEEISGNPSALHNTLFKKQQRRTMLEGGRPAECDYCWRIEDQDHDAHSDRVLKSYENWALPFLDEVRDAPWDANVKPSYVEVSFGNVCNFKCSYCGPHASSKWMEEMQEHGDYPMHRFNSIDRLKRHNLMPIPSNRDNPYVDAFWKWWPDLYPTLMHFRITGGEPLLNGNTFKVLDYVIDHPNPQLTLSINTNLNPPMNNLDMLIERSKRIVGEGKIKHLYIFTSAEAHGQQAEYIRHGMDYWQWIGNMRRLLAEIPGITLNVMSTYNILSIPSYRMFLSDMLAIKHEFGRSDHHALYLDTPYLRQPSHQSVFMLTPDLLGYIGDQVSYMQDNIEEERGDGIRIGHGFRQWEIEKLKRIHTATQFMFSGSELVESAERIAMDRRNFAAFIEEHDRRRGTNFDATFPELAGFRDFCRNTIIRSRYGR